MSTDCVHQSIRFKGFKKGYMFTTKDGVTGYYVDHKQQQSILKKDVSQISQASDVSADKAQKDENDDEEEEEEVKEARRKSKKRKKDKSKDKKHESDKKSKSKKSKSEKKKHKKPKHEKRSKLSDVDNNTLSERPLSPAPKLYQGSSDSSDSSSELGDRDAPRSIITGKRIKLDRGLTLEDRLGEIERAAKRHAMNSQY